MKKMFAFLTPLMLTACMDFDSIEDLNNTPADERAMEELNIPANFNFEMQEAIELHLSAVTNSGNPMAGVPFSVGYVDGADTLWLQNGMIANAAGENLELTLPNTASEVLVRTSHVGLPEMYSLPRTSNVLSLEMGASNIAQGSTYHTSAGLCWGLNFPTTFEYPIEKAPINQAYLQFNSWATSGGTAFPNWNSNTQGYRNATKIY